MLFKKVLLESKETFVKNVFVQVDKYIKTLQYDQVLKLQALYFYLLNLTLKDPFNKKISNYYSIIKFFNIFFKRYRNTFY